MTRSRPGPTGDADHDAPSDADGVPADEDRHALPDTNRTPADEGGHALPDTDRTPADGGGFVLTGPDGATVASRTPGTLGGHRRSRIYGRLDCRTALRAIGRGGYVRDRVFFADEPTARAAGYRPCAVCMPDGYAAWKRGD